MDRQELIALNELAARETEAIRLFRPEAYQTPIFTSTASELLIIGGSRAGKSMCMAARIAAAALGLPVIGWDGKPITLNHPKPPLAIWLIGKGEDHCATWHRLLLEKQRELKMVRDKDTDEWRTYDPRRDQDRSDVKEMEPFIPHRLIEGGYEKGISWIRRREKFFKNITLTNGTVLWYYTSGGEVKKGDPVDIIGIDEHIEIPEHYNEWQVRISDRRGMIIWAICPDRKRNFALNDLMARCDRESTKPKPWFQKVVITFTQNPYIDEEQKIIRKASMDTAHWLNRDTGELLDGDSAVYGEFDEERLTTPCCDESKDDAVDKLLRHTQTIPDDWCRELILDPGSAHPGVLMCAIPPPKLGVDCGVVYDELYIPNSDPGILANELLKKVQGQTFHRFIIDGRAAMQRTIGTAIGKNTYILYADAFRQRGISCELTGSNFVTSPSDWLAGVQGVKLKLTTQPNGRPWLRVLKGACYNFCRMMERYERAIDRNGFVEDKPAQKQIDCLPDCLRYWIASEPVYQSPRKKDPEGGPAWQA